MPENDWLKPSKNNWSELNISVRQQMFRPTWPYTKCGSRLKGCVLCFCGGDMSFTSALTYDFEVFSAAQKMWLEVSSVSNFESFQANRLKLRYRDETTKKPQLAHTLNGSALALPRIVAALLENNQTPEGIKIPKVLMPYCGFEMIN
jgi:seryl-tRNA synthetase